MNPAISFFLVAKHMFDLERNVSGFLVFTGNFHVSDVRTYHFIHLVWGFPVSAGNFHLSDVRTISSTKCGAFWFFAGNFCTCDIRTMTN